MGTSDKGGTTQQYEHHPFQLSVDQLASHFGGLNVEHGLTPSQVNDFRTKYGQNKLEGEEGVKWYAVLFKQISNAMILVCDSQPFLCTLVFFHALVAFPAIC
jgi:Na+-exporting ATPase